jgi:hypothetical protein
LVVVVATPRRLLMPTARRVAERSADCILLHALSLLSFSLARVVCLWSKCFFGCSLAVAGLGPSGRSRALYVCSAFDENRWFRRSVMNRSDAPVEFGPKLFFWFSTPQYWNV